MTLGLQAHLPGTVLERDWKQSSSPAEGKRDEEEEMGIDQSRTNFDNVVKDGLGRMILISYLESFQKGGREKESVDLQYRGGELGSQGDDGPMGLIKATRKDAHGGRQRLGSRGRARNKERDLMIAPQPQHRFDS